MFNYSLKILFLNLIISIWNNENKDVCRDAISKEIGVANWEKVNMSDNPAISAKFDALAKRCADKKETTESKSDAIENKLSN